MSRRRAAREVVRRYTGIARAAGLAPGAVSDRSSTLVLGQHARSSASASRALLAVALLAVSACASRDIVASGAVPGDQPAYCAGTSPVILVAPAPRPGERGAVCTGVVAVRTFPRALCTCEGYTTSTGLETDSFDSAAGPYAPGGTSGDVGVDGELRTSAVVDIHGALAAAGAAGVGLLADLHVAHDLDVGGALGTGVTVTAGGDAHLAGAVDLAALTVAGTLTIPDGVALAGTISAGATVRAPVTIAPPCACGAADLVDIPGFVAAHASDNQDAAIGLTPDRLTDYRGAVSLDLPCGIYYVGPVRGDGALTLRVTGRAALLIDGDLALAAPFTVELATEDAELDLMVGGIVSSDQAIVIGRADHPARTRIYVGGAGTIQLSGDSQLAANLYAPRAAVALSATAIVFGSLFVRRLDQSAPITIHYDVDVRRADVACPLSARPAPSPAR
jgi:hypothetical protein